MIAGKSAIATVGVGSAGLMYYGYNINELAKHSTFEEVAYLLLRGDLPSPDQYKEFCTKLWTNRTIPKNLKTVLEILPKTANPMDVMRTICSVMGILEPESEDRKNQEEKVIRLLSMFGPALLYWYHFANSGKRIQEQTSADDSIAANFMKLLHQNEVPELQIKVFDISLILYAEHDFNASTFANRITISTLSDIYSGICTGIGTLKGNLHGGANEAAMALLSPLKSTEEAESLITQMISQKKLVMGFGHRVYKNGDPRVSIIKEYSRLLSNESYGDKNLYEVSEHVENKIVGEKKIFPNLDFYSASAYHQCGIPAGLFTPIFVISRTTGWAAHAFEQRADNKLIRPNSEYCGLGYREYVTMTEREKNGL